MSEQPALRIAEVEQPFGCDPPIVHCPICGQAMLVFDDEGFGQVAPCNHLAFIYVGEAGEFEYLSDDAEAMLEAVEEGVEDEEDDWEIEGLLAKAGFDRRFLVFSITYGGMGCGPMWFADTFGFDYSKVAEKR